MGRDTSKYPVGIESGLEMFNLFKYKSHPEAIIISCYYNSENNAYRLKAFKVFYDKIKHLNHKIIECVIGDSKPQLPNNENIEVISTDSKLWHKESLLNKIIRELPAKYKYVFWVDADVIFTDRGWLVNSVKKLEEGSRIVQPFEYCVHLDRNQLYPNFNINKAKKFAFDKEKRNPKLWRAFCANYVDNEFSTNKDYNIHGHVGFAWGARREVLNEVPLFDRCLIGGADHIIAHAAAGHIPNHCITKSFYENIEEVEQWSWRFYQAVRGRIGYVKGNLYHIWHGDLNKREYLKRIQEFTPENKGIVNRDKNGLHIHNSKYVDKYFEHRENTGGDDGFWSSMILGYMTNSTAFGWMFGGDPIGATIGDALNDSESTEKDVDTSNDNFS